MKSSHTCRKKKYPLHLIFCVFAFCAFTVSAHATRLIKDYEPNHNAPSEEEQKDDAAKKAEEAAKKAGEGIDLGTVWGDRDNPPKKTDTTYSAPPSTNNFLPPATPGADTSSQNASAGAKEKTKEGTKKTNCPVEIQEGKKIIRDRDYVGSGDNPLIVERTYNPGITGGLFSKRSGWYSNYDIRLRFNFTNGQQCDDTEKNAGILNAACSSNYPFSSSNIASIDFIKEGKSINMVWSSGVSAWLESGKSVSDLRLTAGANNTWIMLSQGEGLTQNFGPYGRLTKITNRHGVAQTLEYENPTGNKLLTVTHASGRKITFKWFSLGDTATAVNQFFQWRILGFTTPEGKTTLYTNTDIYTCPEFDLGVIYPDNLGSMGYGCYAANAQFHEVTVDGGRYKRYTLGSDGRVSSSGLADGKETSSFAYSSLADGSSQTVVTNALGQKTTYNYKGGNISQMGRTSTDCPSGSANYNSIPGTDLLDWKEDWKGNRTSYLYTADQKLRAEYFNGITTEYIWNPDGTLNEQRLWQGAISGIACKPGDTCPAATVTKSKTHYEYYGAEANYRLKSVSRSDEAGNEAKTTYTYTFNANKTVATKTIDGSRTDVNDITTYTYNTQGDLVSVVDAVGNQTSYEYPPNSDRFNKVIFPNGNVVDYIHDARQRISTATYTSEYSITKSYKYNSFNYVTEESSSLGTIKYEYDEVGLLRKIKTPVSLEPLSGSTISEQWIQYDYEQPIASPTKTSLMFNQGGSVITQGVPSKLIYNSAGLVATSTGPLTTAKFEYDENLNVKSTTDALNRSAYFKYDAENQVNSIQDRKGGIVKIDRPELGKFNVTDPLAQTTTITRASTTQTMVSPDSGTTINTYSNEGLLTKVQRLDYFNVSNTITYDALNRPLSEWGSKYGQAGQKIKYFYDTYVEASTGASCENGKGRICGIEYNQGSTSYAYFPSGALKRKTQTISGMSFNQTYTYDSKGRLWIEEYPNGIALRYNYNAASQVNLIEKRIAGVWSNLVGKTEYAYSSLSAEQRSKTVLNFANGVRIAYSRDQQGKLINIDPDTSDAYYNSVNKTNIDYTQVGEIQRLYKGNLANYPAFDYDPNSQLERYKTYIDSRTGTGYNYVNTYTYDANGNRKTDARGGGIYTSNGVVNTWAPTETDTYNYTPGTNKLASITGSRAKTFGYDAFGNMVSKSGYGGSISYTYDGLNRLSNSNGGIYAYAYNAANLRIFKNSPGGMIRYLYNEAGQLIAETANNSSTLDKIYVYWGGTPVAVIRNNQAYYIESDHLGRPTNITDTAKTSVWSATYSPFERTAASGTFGAFNIGLPGQYFDSETGLWYNWNRYYDASIGRYIQSDPIGLEGGVNTYSYVSNNPLSYIDSLGLDLTPAQQDAITKAANDWANSNVPYRFGGTTKKGADCSGSVSSIYNQAGVHIGRLTSQGFKQSPLFGPIQGSPQVGDVGVYPGHVVIYGGDNTGSVERDVWSASHTGGPDFGPANSAWYGTPTWYRYK
ncbi:MAG: RHS repeat-associated core domain-containing protein [Marinagarivorans sp.]